MKLVPIDKIESPFANACYNAMQRIHLPPKHMSWTVIISLY